MRKKSIIWNYWTNKSQRFGLTTNISYAAGISLGQDIKLIANLEFTI
jgi:hypothetical protein